MNDARQPGHEEALNRFQRVDAFFRRVIHLRPEERTRYLEEHCVEDTSLRDDVIALLEHDGCETGALDRPLMEESSRMLHELHELHPMRHGALGCDLQNDDAAIPATIGRYRIIRRIAEGGMGTVFEAEQEQPRRMVAVKVLRSSVSSGSALRRFHYEAEILGHLRHPAIAQIYEVGTHQGAAGEDPFFAMEFVPDARDLLAYARDEQLDIEQRLRIFVQICRAVQYGHQRGVIHRDLKPGNILIDAAGQPKIIDFGVARATDPDLALTTMQTNVGQIIGTLAYMSPEQCDGDPAAIDVRSDVYSLGVVLYELLCGQLPYELGRSLLDGSKTIREQPPARLSAIEPRVRGDLETVALKALEKERDRRYQSAAELADDLERSLDNQPIHARPPSLAYQTRMFARRNRPLMIAAGAAALALIAATIISTTFALQTQREQTKTTAALEREGEQRQLAEQRFNELRRLANTFIFEIDTKLERLAGATAARETLVSTGLHYLDQLAGQADDPQLLAELAEGYVRIGDIQGNPSKANLGDTAAALRSYESARGLQERVIERAGDGIDARLALLAIDHKIVEVLLHVGRSAKSLEQLDVSRAAVIALAEAHPDNARVTDAVYMSYSMRGEALKRMGRTDDALREFEQALTLAERRTGNASEDAEALRDLTISHNDVGTMLARTGRDEKALRHFAIALELRRRVVAEHSGELRSQRDLLISLQRIAERETALHRFDDALGHLEEAQQLGEAMVDADPNDRRSVLDLTIIQEKIGDLLIELDRPNDALERFNGVLALREGLRASDPANLHYGEAVALAQDRIGDLYTELGQLTDAAIRFEQAYRIASETAERDAHMVLAQTIRCNAAWKLSEAAARRSAEAGGGAADAARAERRAWAGRTLEVVEAAERRGMTLLHVPVAIERLRELVRRADHSSPAAVAESMK